MANLSKVRVQLLDEKTGEVLEEVDVLTSADAVTFADGQTFQQKLDAGTLRGTTGTAGTPGAKGADGKTWHTSTTNPATSLGAIGDMHLNTSTYDISEKTAAAVWTVRGNIKGETGATGVTGATGADGKTWHITAAVPENTLGIIGDVHLNTATFDIREKTAAAVWTARGNIKGAAGATGATGDPGPKGDPGDNVKFGTTLAAASDVKLFLKKV